ncbi:hypothetical protein [Fimbriiglobus ruber]|uniref:Uncharacterized protein n=1 Tax=Fimbriiglobus ruber TaxID=1908690 RepID=A0A225DMS0_9BACT|nr:hypothetical protein [Fimbriiglobus ruber]OWK42313.1 hypothetical protein FRUB_04391 [Fimbriiglobus ruber]
MSAVLQVFDPIDASAAPEPEQQDWLMCLVELLAQLETIRCELAGFRIGTDHAQIAGHVETMIHLTDRLARETEFDGAQAGLQSDAITKVGSFYSALNGIRKPPGKGMFGKMKAALFGTGTPSPAAVRDCLFVAISALGAYFVLFAYRLIALEEVAGWRDAANTFLTDFKQLATDLPE